MGPGPVEHNPPKHCGRGEDDWHEDDESWHDASSEVELHGVVGLDEFGSGDMSGAESDPCDDDSRDRYVGYQTLPTSDDSLDTDNVRVSAATAKSDFEEALSAADSVHLKDSDFKIDDKPKPIELTEDKIESIKKAMSSFTLPAPSWAKEIASDNELTNLLEKLRAQKTSRS